MRPLQDNVDYELLSSDSTNYSDTSSENELNGYDEIPESPFERMKPLRDSFHLRINTFDNYPPDSPIKPYDLANNYFYYIGYNLKTNDVCQCTICGGVLGGWQDGDDVTLQHRRHFPDCRSFLRIAQNDCIAIKDHILCLEMINRLDLTQSADRDKTFESEAWEHRNLSKRMVDIGLYYTGYGDVVQCFKCNCYIWNWTAEDIPEKEHDCPIVDFALYRNYMSGTINYTLRQNRLMTFLCSTWKHKKYLPAEQMADAGLYFIGKKDETRCCQCNVIISDWLENDIPIVEHVRWANRFNTQCLYVTCYNKMKDSEERKTI